VTGIFKANNPNNNFLLFIYGLLVKLPLFIFPKPAILQTADGVLYKGLVYYGQTNTGTPVLLSILSFLLLFLQAVLFNKMVNDHRMLQRPNYLTGMSYLLVTSVFSEWFVFSSALVANTFLIWVWAKLCSLHNQPSAKTSIYNIGLAIGLAAFFYQPAIVFVFLFVVGMASIRPFRLNEWMIGLLGLLTSFYFFAAWLFLSNRWQGFELPSYQIALPQFNKTWLSLTAIIIVATTILIGIYFVQSNMRRQVVQTRKSWYLIYFYFVVAAFVPFINTNNFISWIIVAVPAAIMMAAAFFYPDKKWFPTLVHWALAGIYIAGAFYFR
jgi:hypothetical protein